MSLFKTDPEEQNRKRLRNILAKTLNKDCPDGWEYKTFSIGGLTEVGFSEQNPELLLVVSSNGRGLFNCSSLEKIDRDHNDEFDIDYSNLTCKGIGELKEENIRIAGLHGGGLPNGNSNGESIETMALDWPRIDVIFQPKWTSVYSERDTEKCIKVFSTDTLKIYGFSPTGKYFVIGTSSDLLVYKKST